MANILDYLRWRGDVSFEHYPLNDVDNIIFSVITHVDFSGVVSHAPEGEGVLLSEAAKLYFESYDGLPPSMGLIVPAAVYDALELVMMSPRYKDVKLRFYADEIDEDKEKQFAAITFELPYGQGIYIAFRGTDDTLVGWKEDFNMSFMNIVPSQVEALRYVELAGRLDCATSITIGGHSKGGNLAVFGGCFCSKEVKNKIKRIYCNDAPGFSNDMIESPDYTEIKERIVRLIPEMSVVGMLLENPAPYKVIKSSAKGVFQHDPFSWQVLGHRFEGAEKISENSVILKNTLAKWLSESTPEELGQIINSLYVFLSSTESTTLTELNDNRRRIMGSMTKMDAETKRSILRIVKLVTGVESRKLKNGIRHKFLKRGGAD